MMNNLFSIFDPCTGFMSMNWLSTFLFLLTMPYKIWIKKNKMMMMFSLLTNTLHKEMYMLMKYKGTNIIMISMMMLILINNLMGLTPYVFTSSAHLVFSLSMALPMWTAMMMFGWTKKTKMMFCHLVPTGTPSVLMPFMVMIESISNIIRPGSLAVRLTANMIAGHLLMSLMGNNPSIMISLIIVMFMMLMTFEIAVAMIQSYVFMTLTTLYSSEI